MYNPTGAYPMLAIILLLFLAGVAYVDLRSRRGWGLALVALALASYGIWLANFLLAVQQAPSTGDDLAGAIIFAIYLAIYLAFALVLWIVALVEAGASRQWRWFVGLLVAALVPGLLILAIVKLRFVIPGLNVIGIGLGLIPVFIILAYGVVRSVRPVTLRAV